MKRITQSMDYEGDNHKELINDLRQWHKQHPFNTGIDWQHQYMHATMTDEDCLAFCLRHPQYADRFKDIT